MQQCNRSGRVRKEWHGGMVIFVYHIKLDVAKSRTNAMRREKVYTTIWDAAMQRNVSRKQKRRTSEGKWGRVKKGSVSKVKQMRKLHKPKGTKTNLRVTAGLKRCVRMTEAADGVELGLSKLFACQKYMWDVIVVEFAIVKHRSN